MFRRTLLLALFCLGVQMALRGETPISAPGNTLMALGFYAGAEDAYRAELSNTQSAENIKGLMQALLAQEKASQARDLLESPLAAKLTVSEKTLYEALIRAQEGSYTELSGISPAELDANETDLMYFFQGLELFSKKNLQGAEALWIKLRPSSQLRPWVAALSAGSRSEKLQAPNPSANTAPEIPKGINSRSWPTVRNYLLGMICSGQGTSARTYILGNTSAMPKGESELLIAYSYPAQTPERATALMKALPDLESPELLSFAVGLCARETVINMTDVEDQIKQRKSQPTVAMLLAQNYIQKGAFSHAYKLLTAISGETIASSWRSVYYSTLAVAAENLPTPRRREAADALAKWRALPSTTKAESDEISRQIGDILYQNGDYSDAAIAYSKYPSHLLQTVLSYLKADRPDDARTALLKQNSAEFSQALLAYLLYIRDHEGNVEDAYKPFERHSIQSQERWPIDYLRIDSLSATKPEAALSKLEGLAVSNEAPYKDYFEMEKYQLLMQLGRRDEARQMLDGILSRKTVSREFALLGFEQALIEGRGETAMEIAPKIGDLPNGDRVRLMLIDAESLGNPPELLAQDQKAIESLAPGERIRPLILMAKRWALIGHPEKARTIIEALKESTLGVQDAQEIEFLRATIDEITADPAAEGEFLALSERPEDDIRLRGLIRYAAYETQHNKAQVARDIFYKKMYGIVSKPFPKELLDNKEEILKALTIIATALPDKDADVLRGWIQEQFK
jgi:hypothetical protein